MKVLFVTSSDPQGGLTGVAAYVRGLADALANGGHEVAHLYVGGRSWRPGSRLTWGVCRGKLTASVVNSPVRSRFSWHHPMQDIRHPLLEGLLEKALLRIHPDLVHLHDLAGIPAGFVVTARDRGFPVVISLHDFWPFCQQLLLIRPGLVPCNGSDGGRNCAFYCFPRPRVLPRVLQYLETTVPSLGAQPFLYWIIRLRNRLRGRMSSQFVIPFPRSDRRAPDPTVVAALAARESSMREALLHANLLLAVSNFARSKYIQHGYPADRIRVMRHPTQFAGRVAQRLRAFRGYPVRFGYLGRVTPWKGAHLLAEATRGIPPEGAQFTFYGAVEEEDCRYLSALAGDRRGVEFKGRYTHDRLEAILEEIDVLIFPSVMHETQGLVGQEAQAAGLPIIGADRGAIPEYVRHGVNGLLFSAGSVSSLRAQILRIVQDPNLITQLSSNIPPPERMDEHVGEVVRAYEGAVGLAEATVAQP